MTGWDGCSTCWPATGGVRRSLPPPTVGRAASKSRRCPCLAADPPVLLMMNPGAIDPIARLHLQNEFLSLQQRVKKTVVIVTHDIDGRYDSATALQ